MKTKIVSFIVATLLAAVSLQAASPLLDGSSHEFSNYAEFEASSLYSQLSADNIEAVRKGYELKNSLERREIIIRSSLFTTKLFWALPIKFASMGGLLALTWTNQPSLKSPIKSYMTLAFKVALAEEVIHSWVKGNWRDAIDFSLLPFNFACQTAYRLGHLVVAGALIQWNNFSSDVNVDPGFVIESHTGGDLLIRSRTSYERGHERFVKDVGVSDESPTSEFVTVKVPLS